ncbi:YopX family protein [Campylobacter concisus]|uniref:YopX family protein n=1 Tax=Campylobacter concisus TaxID=199 RepID=UPI0015E17BBA|nr:YopX family protein [Campylobacter concisus]
MRETKFRAFLCSDKRLPNGITLGYEKYPRGIYEVMDLNFASEIVTLWSEKEQTSFEVSLRKVELLQYTGYKDKNGKEIYGGHIVSVKYLYDKRSTDRAQVVWREDKASFGLKSLKGLTNEVYELYQVTAEHNLEVIGNIYENEGLLNETIEI